MAVKQRQDSPVCLVIAMQLNAQRIGLQTTGSHTSGEVHAAYSTSDMGNSKVTVPNRMCTSIADCHENTAVVALVKFLNIFPPELLEDPLVVGDDR